MSIMLNKTYIKISWNQHVIPFYSLYISFGALCTEKVHLFLICIILKS